MGTGGTPALQSPKTGLWVVEVGNLPSHHHTEFVWKPVAAAGFFLPPTSHNLLPFSNIDGQQVTKCAVSVYSTFYGQAERAISNGKLNVLLRLHIRPINVVVFHGPY